MLIIGKSNRCLSVAILLSNIDLGDNSKGVRLIVIQVDQMRKKAKIDHISSYIILSSLGSSMEHKSSNTSKNTKPFSKLIVN